MGRFFKDLEEVLLCPDPDEKGRLFNRVYKDYNPSELTRELAEYRQVEQSRVPCPEYPSWQSFCRVVPPSEVPRRSRLEEEEGRQNLLHAVCHIEYSAFELAVDTLCRYRSMPVEFYTDFLQTAAEELEHFKLVRSLLHESGSGYGHLPVHNGLWEGAMRAESLLERLAILPRYQEANGLDANSRMISRLKSLHHPFISKILTVFEKIYHDEIVHVARGNRWFEYEAARAGHERSVFFDILDRHFPRRVVGRPLDRAGRLEAGFSKEDLERLS